MTNKLQLVLIDNLIKSIITLAKVLQGSVSTHLRCDGTFNDQFITQSLLSFMVKKDNWSTFFMKHGNTGILARNVLILLIAMLMHWNGRALL